MPVECYSLDPVNFGLQLFYELTRSKKLIPSRIRLHEGIDGYFEALEKSGIKNLRQLIRSMANIEKIAALASETGVPEDYLILLKREAGSYISKPFLLSEFPGIPLEYTEVLLSRKIRNTRDFFESVQTSLQQIEVSKATGIPEARLREIFSLCDLSRITGVGGFYARIVYHAGIRSVKEFADTDAATHNELYLEILDKYNYPVKALGEDDLLYCINYAILLSEFNSSQNK